MTTDFVKVKSESIPNKNYVIRKTGWGWVCSCPDAVLRNHECKHLKKFHEENRKKGQNLDKSK